jgi:hypothetical protein
MFCDRCGTRLAESQRFCPSCGKSAGMPLTPTPGRIAGHIRLLGIFWLASSAIHLIPGMFLMTFFGHHGMLLGPDVPLFLPGMMRMIGVFLIGGAVLGLMAGWGLLERQPWARTLAIVLGCFHLINMPFGTALGIYTLWVLLPSASEEEYRRMARVA